MTDKPIFTKEELQEHDALATEMNILLLRKGKPIDKIISVLEFFIKKIVRAHERAVDLRIKIYETLIKVLEKIIEEEKKYK